MAKNKLRKKYGSAGLGVRGAWIVSQARHTKIAKAEYWARVRRDIILRAEARRSR